MNQPDFVRFPQEIKQRFNARLLGAHFSSSVHILNPDWIVNFQTIIKKRWYHMFCFWKKRKREILEIQREINELKSCIQVLLRERKLHALLLSDMDYVTSYFRDEKILKAGYILKDIIDSTYVFMKPKKTIPHRAKTKKKGKK